MYLDPPGVPHIEGYTEGDNVENGHKVVLRCVSKNGNPPTQLVWFKNDQLIQNHYRYLHISIYYVIISKLYLFISLIYYIQILYYKLTIDYVTL